MGFPLGVIGEFAYGKNTQSAGTAITQLIAPLGGQALGVGTGFIHLTDLVYTSSTTAHVIFLMRPLNYTTLTSAAAKNQKVLNIKADPGIYSTNYKYGSVAPSLADRAALSSGDYLAYQCADGTWVLDTVSSVSTLAVTMATNVPGAGVTSGARVYLFGTTSDSDPATNAVPVSLNTQTSKTAQAIANQATGGIMCVLHDGDPLMIYDGNGTAADTLERFAGYHSRW